ncbi:Cdc37, partial [Symbiodinium pilosum]
MMQPPPQEASATPSWHYEQQMRLEQLLSQLMQQGEGGANASFPAGHHPHQPHQQHPQHQPHQPHQSHQPVPGDR